MSTQTNNTTPRDDLDAYIATFTDEERHELASAEAALDLALLLHEARTTRGLTQREAAARSGVKQQAISRWEQSQPNVQLESLRRYLNALGYAIDIVLRDAETGEVMGSVGQAAASAQTNGQVNGHPIEGAAASNSATGESGHTREDAPSR